MLGCSGESPCVSDDVEAFDCCSELAREVVDAFAAMLSTSLWNLRFVVARAGCVSDIFKELQI